MTWPKSCPSLSLAAEKLYLMVVEAALPLGICHSNHVF